MKQSTMIFIFVAMLLAVFGIAWYMFSRGTKALEGSAILPFFKWGFWILIAAFFVGQFFERGNPNMFQMTVSRIGSLSLAFFLHVLLFVVLVDLVRVFQHFFHFIPNSLLSSIFTGKMLFFYGIGLAGIATLGGNINARNAMIKQVNLTIDKKDSQRDSLKVVLATDVHLGVIRSASHAKKLVRQINEQKPDIVLFGGDLVDHNPNPVMKYDIGAYFEEIDAPLGVYATTGNHEFIGKPTVTIEYFERHGITFIRDSLFTIEGIVQIVGRDDKDKMSHTGEKRKSIASILQDNTLELPKLLLDHQPVDYDIAAEHDIDLMMSGHTHKGQMWPLSFITNMVYDNHYGLMQKANTWFYTSSGYGTWGPPVRTGNRPELVVFDLEFRKTGA